MVYIVTINGLLSIIQANHVSISNSPLITFPPILIILGT